MVGPAGSGWPGRDGLDRGEQLVPRGREADLPGVFLAPAQKGAQLAQLLEGRLIEYHDRSARLLSDDEDWHLCGFDQLGRHAVEQQSPGSARVVMADEDQVKAVFVAVIEQRCRGVIALEYDMLDFDSGAVGAVANIFKALGEIALGGLS